MPDEVETGESMKSFICFKDEIETLESETEKSENWQTVCDNWIFLNEFRKKLIQSIFTLKFFNETIHSSIVRGARALSSNENFLFIFCVASADHWLVFG